jgi:DNA polymerase elongation subunit (family B)
MTLFGYTSRNIPDPKIYEDMLEKRMIAKKNGDKATANALKLVANTTYGATLNKYNDLYDPLMGRSVCITGQLFLLELANHLRTDCETLKVIQINTDGIMVSFDDSEYGKVLEADCYLFEAAPMWEAALKAISENEEYFVEKRA